jgi:ATP-dependent Clp protease adapter protein ClpS
MMRLTVLAVLLSALHLGNAFVVAPTFFGQRSLVTPLFAQGENEGGAAIAKPAIKLDQKTETVTKGKSKIKQEAKVFDPISRRQEEFEDAPMFKLMLLSDASYDAGHVIDRLCAIVEDMDEDQAANVFKSADATGQAMCGKYPFERAELFKEQLQRSTPMIFTDLVEENK